MLGALKAMYVFVSHIISYIVFLILYSNHRNVLFLILSQKCSCKYGHSCFIIKTWHLQQYWRTYHLQSYRLWCVYGETCTVYCWCTTVFGLHMSCISRQDKMYQFVAPTTSDLTPADVNWWEILQGIVCLAVWGEMSLRHKPGLLYCARSSWCWDWDTEWTDSFCKYCVSVETIMFKYIKWLHFYNKLLASFDFPVLLEGLHNLLNDWISLTFHRNPHFSHVHWHCGLSYDKSTASSKASSPHSAI